MYKRLIPAVIDTFSHPGETERAFLERLQQADIRLRKNFATDAPVESEPYAEPILRSAYLFRYLGHYTLQLGDLLNDLEGTPAAEVLARPQLNLAALCGGPCPEAIALASLHQQAGGRRLSATVLDLHADAWADCWPISTAIARAYPVHPDVTITGLQVDLLRPSLSAAERGVLGDAQVFTTMNCLNELVGLDADRVRRALAERLDALAPGTLVLASDQAKYDDCERGLQMLHQLLEERGAVILLAELRRSEAHVAQNRFKTPEWIAWIYGAETNNIFRIWVRQLRLAALIR